MPVRLAYASVLAQAIVETVREPLLVLNAELRVEWANASFYRTFQATPQETENRVVYELGNHQWDIPRLRWLLEHVLPENHQFTDFEVQHHFEHLGPRTMLLNSRALLREGGRPGLILLDLAQDFDAIDLGHADVQQHKIRRAVFSATPRTPAEQEVQDFLAILEAPDLVLDPRPPQVLLDQSRMPVVVFDDEEDNLLFHRRTLL